MKFLIQPVAAILLSAVLVTAAPASSANQVEKRYVSGQCGIHVTQHQRNEDGVGADYTFDIRIYDAIQATIGGTNALDIPSLHSGDVPSQLPYQLVITAGQLDADPVAFAYGGDSWDSGTRCSTGAFDGGSRQMDCGFNC